MNNGKKRAPKGHLPTRVSPRGRRANELANISQPKLCSDNPFFATCVFFGGGVVGRMKR